MSKRKITLLFIFSNIHFISRTHTCFVHRMWGESAANYFSIECVIIMKSYTLAIIRDFVLYSLKQTAVCTVSLWRWLPYLKKKANKCVLGVQGRRGIAPTNTRSRQKWETRSAYGMCSFLMYNTSKTRKTIAQTKIRERMALPPRNGHVQM